MTLRDTNRPDTCQVPGCDNTMQIAKHTATGIYACRRCRSRYAYKGSFEYTIGRAELAAVCSKCNRDTKPQYMGTDGICHACKKYYRLNGTYERAKLRRTQGMSVRVCQQCRSRSLSPKNSFFRGGKWICNRCRHWYDTRGNHRPRVRDATYCVNCTRPLSRGTNDYGGHGLCRTCTSYKHKTGKMRSPELIKEYAPHGWCECGKPATKQVDLRTGALYVHPTKTGTSDAIRAEVQEWAEWVCDDCAGLEAEMQHIDTSEYRPGALIARD